jgi:glutamate N-acetyltransferase/amino-acid N-acetyltransferase
MTGVSPLAPERFPELAPIDGVRLAAFACGIRYTGRDDLMLAELAPDSAIAGVFTRSLTAPGRKSSRLRLRRWRDC